MNKLFIKLNISIDYIVININIICLMIIGCL